MLNADEALGYDRIFERRAAGEKLSIPKAMEANFRTPRTAEERTIKDAIDSYHQQQAAEWEAEMFRQAKRLADAERALKFKETKKALNDQRVATNKIAAFQRRLADLKRTDLKPRDSNVYPHYYSAVMINENGRSVVRPMRYLLRPNGKPDSYDERYPGCYNARRDSLEGYWKDVFGRHHGVVLASAFFEYVPRYRAEHRAPRAGEKEQSVLLRFTPRPARPMVLACLWDLWQKEGEPELYSFALITDKPPPEVAEAGHDRCVIPLKQHNIKAWLNPEGQSKADLYKLLDDREPFYYEHALAA